MKKVLGNIILAIYAVIAVFTTVCLLSYNEFKVTEFGDNSLILVTNEELSPDFENGDLVIVNGSNKDEIKVGDKVFFYREDSREVEICLGTVNDVQVISSSEATFTFDGDYIISDEYVIGSSDNVTVIPVVGTILSVLESKWGFLFLIIFPVLIAFIYEIVAVYTEIKESKKEENNKKQEESKKQD